MIIDNYKFIIWELLLHTVRVLLNQKNYKVISYMTNVSFLANKKNQSTSNVFGLDFFVAYLESLNQIKKQRLNSNRISHSVDLLVQRGEEISIGHQEIVDADMLLYVITLLNNPSSYWRPLVSIYNNRYSTMGVFSAMVSKSHFEKFKVLFGVDNRTELVKKIELALSSHKKPNYGTYGDAVPDLNDMFPSLDKIGTL